MHDSHRGTPSADGRSPSGRIYDAFMFFNELDILEIRLNELYSVVDVFVIVEAAITHSGRPKELVFEANRQRFGRFADKICYVPLAATDRPLSLCQNSWEREHAQRDHIHQVLTSEGAQPQDMLIVSDVDEIPKASVIAAYSAGDGHRKLDMAFFYYYLNLRVAPAGWAAAFIVPFGHVAKPLTTIRTEVNTPTVSDAGWHFSYMGGVDSIRAKLQSFAHTDLDTPEYNNEGYIRECLKLRLDLFGRGWKLEVVPVPRHMPKYVTENQHRFAHLLATHAV